MVSAIRLRNPPSGVWTTSRASSISSSTSAGSIRAGSPSPMSERISGRVKLASTAPQDSRAASRSSMRVRACDSAACRAGASSFTGGLACDDLERVLDPAAAHPLHHGRGQISHVRPAPCHGFHEVPDLVVVCAAAEQGR